MKKLYKDFIIFFLFILFAGYLSLSKGICRYWDAYHFYNPYAFLNDRYLVDIMPTGIQSYFNPLLDIPYYLCIKYFNSYPEVVTFLWGFSYALLLFLVYKISSLIFNNQKKFIVISVIIASGLDKIVNYIGNLGNDIFIADLALISLYVLIKSFYKINNRKNIILSGFIIGSAVGLKLTAIIFAIPLFLSFIIFHKKFHNPIKSLFIFIFSIISGFLLFDGFWLYKIYILFGNPVFPYFNWIFHSPLINSSDVYSSDYKIEQNFFLIDKLLFITTDKGKTVCLAFKTLYIFFFINLIINPFINKEKFNNYFKLYSEYVDFILIFLCFSYILWINIGTERYFSPILALIAIIFIVVMFKIFYLLKDFFILLINKIQKIKEKDYELICKRIYISIVFIILFLLFSPNYTPVDEGAFSRVAAKNKIFDLEKPDIPDNSIVIVQPGAALIIPFLNSNAKYIHLNDIRFTKKGKTLLSDNIVNKIKEEIVNNNDKVYFITPREVSKISKNNFENIKSKIYKNIEIDNKKENLLKEIKMATNIEIKSKLEKELNSLEHIKISTKDIAKYELYNLDLNTQYCNEIKVLNNPQNNTKQAKYLDLYFCKLEIIKNVP